MFVVAGITNKLPLEEGDVNDGGVEVDKLEDEDFEGQVVVVLRLGSVHFPVGEFDREVLVHSSHGHDEHQVDLKMRSQRTSQTS